MQRGRIETVTLRETMESMQLRCESVEGKREEYGLQSVHKKERDISNKGGGCRGGFERCEAIETLDNRHDFYKERERKRTLFSRGIDRVVRFGRARQLGRPVTGEDIERGRRGRLGGGAADGSRALRRGRGWSGGWGGGLRSRRRCSRGRYRRGSLGADETAGLGPGA